MSFYQWLNEWWTGLVVMAGGALFIWLSLALLGEYRRAFMANPLSVMSLDVLLSIARCGTPSAIAVLAACRRMLPGGRVRDIGYAFVFRRPGFMASGQIDPRHLTASADCHQLRASDRLSARGRAFARRITLITVAALLLAGCDSHAYYEEAKLYVSEAQGVLREARVCGARVPCDDLVKFEAGAWRLGPFSRGGVSINVYQVADKAVADRIVQRFDERQRSMPDVPVHVRIYASRRGEAKRLTLERKLG